MSLIRGEQITGSVASASLAVTSSYANTASYVNPLDQDVIITGSLTVTGSVYGDTISSPYFTGSFYGNGTGIFSGSFSGSISANLQDVTNNGNVTILPITASSYYGNGLQIVGNAAITGSTDISGSLSINGVDYEFTSASFDTRILNNSTSISLLSSSYEQFITIYNTGSFTGSFTGSLRGTASWAQNALTASYVNPLHQNVIITGSLLVTQSHISTVDYIDFNPNVAAPGFNTGRLHWVDDTKTLQLDTDVVGFELEIGHQNIVRGRNITGYTLTKGMVVYINGESGNRPTFTTASWEGDPSSAATLGLVAQNITDNQTGYVVTNGVLRGINTNAFAPGTQLYLSSSGQYTSTVPISPNHEVRLGKTITQATNGYIYVDIMNGYELGELHDVLIVSKSNGDLISWDSGSRVWKNTKQLTGSYELTGSLSATSFTGSLYGTSSWAENSTTASYSLNAAALSSSYVIDSASFDSRINSINLESLGPGVVAVDVATSASLRSSTYYNGIANDGVGATITSTANGALGVIDGVTTLLNWRVLVKNQAAQLQNGVYELTQTGSAAAPFILTRATDADQTIEFSPQVVIPTKGLLNKSINFSQITEDPNIGVDNVIYQQLTGSNNYISQQTVGTQAVNQIPIYTSVSKELTRGSSTFTYTVSTGQFRIRNIPYVYPSTQGANGTVLMNNGSGTLRWANNFTGSFSGSFTGSLAGTSSWARNALTASYVQNAQTSSYALYAVSSSHSDTASYVNTLNQDVLITGSLTVLQGATIYGSSSFQYVTSSQLAVSASTISVNIFEPVERFGGLVIYDSGSSNATASLLWDSLHNHFIYQNVSGAAYAGAMFLAGPRNTGSLGDEPTLTQWFVARSDGGDHLENTQIYSSGSITQITGSLTVTNGITASLTGTASYALEALSSSYALNASSADTASYVLNAVSSSYSDTASYVQNAQTASYVLNAVSSSYSNTASYVESAQTASYVLNSISSSFASTASFVATASWADNAVTASYVTLAQTASYVENAVSSSYALTASYALNGGGSTDTGSLLTTASVSLNTITFTKGDGSTFPITVDTGSGGGGGNGINTTASFSSLATWNFNHALNNRNIVIQTYDSSYNQIIPQNINLVDDNNATITFPTSESGFAIASLGGTTVSASYALTASYALNGGGGGGISADSLFSYQFLLMGA